MDNAIVPGSPEHGSVSRVHSRQIETWRGTGRQESARIISGHNCERGNGGALLPT
jgi:hypothetical protein